MLPIVKSVYLIDMYYYQLTKIVINKAKDKR